MKPTTKQAYDLFHEGVVALSQVEADGMRIDVPRLDRTIARTAAKIERMTDRLKQDEVWRLWRRRFGDRAKIGSRHQLGKILFGELAYEIDAVTDNGRAKMDGDALSCIDLPFVQHYLTVEKYKKMLSTNLRGIRREVVDGFLRPSFNPHLVTSFRSSSDRPNFQNQPVRDKLIGRAVRSCFVPRDGRVLVEVDYSALEFRVAACVVGNTLIETIDGPQKMKDITKRVADGDKVYVYGYDREKGRIAVSKVSAGGRTRRKAKVWKVTLDNGESVVATGDHGFMLRDGSYLPLSELEVGASLMPLYIRNKRSGWGTNYTEVFLNNGGRMMAHSLIALDVLDTVIKGSNLVVHHRDGNGTNNSLSNVEVMMRSRHMQIHSKQGWANSGPERKKILVDRLKSKENRELVKEINKRRRVEWTEAMWKEWKRKLVESIKRNGGRAGKKNGMYGKKHSEEAKALFRAAKIGKKTGRSWNKGLTKENSEGCRKISLAKKGKPGWNKGKRKDPVKVVCEWCGNEFFVPWISRTRPRRFCDRSCGAYYRNNVLGINPMKGKTPWCKGLRWRRSDGKIKELVETTCQWCGNVFTQYEGGSKRFCNTSCSMSHTNHKRFHNHKIVSIEYVGRRDVYNITVDGIHNYATSAGVVIKNCHWRDEKMIEYASDPALDIHRDMAAECYAMNRSQVTGGVRFFAKNQFVFPELYGSWYVNCAANLWSVIDSAKLTTRDGVPLKEHLRSKGITAANFERHVKDVEERFNRMFPTWSRKKEEWWSKYRRRGWFPMMTGFCVAGVWNRKQLMNFPIQGPAFHCLLWSLVELNRWLRANKMQSMITGQIHDSLVIDVHRDELPDVLAKVVRVMTEDVRRAWPWLVVPLSVDAKMSETNWFEIRSVET